MKKILCYRGQVYESTSENVETTFTGVFVKYRGVSYPVRRPVNPITSRHKSNLKYRGVPYIPRPITHIPQGVNGTGTAAVIG